MRTLRLAGWTAAMTLLASAAAFAGPTPEQVLTRAKQAMTGAKTYQATMIMNMNMGQMGTVSMKMDLQQNSAKQKHMRMAPVGQPTGRMASQPGMAGMMNAELTDDGKTAYIYFPKMNQYMKMPSGRGMMGMPDPSNMPAYDKNSTYRMLPSERVGGRPAYVIEITPKSPRPGMPANKAVMFIDQATYRFRQMKAGNPAQGMSMTIVVQNDSVNQPLKPGLFSFRPPKGATEMSMGGPGAGMGRPGAPGGPRPPR